MPQTKPTPGRHALAPTDEASVLARSPLEVEAIRAAQRAFDEVMAGGKATYSSTHSRFAAKTVTDHAAAREKLIDDGIAAGKFPESRRDHYAAAYDNDPGGTTQLVGTLAAGLVVPPAKGRKAGRPATRAARTAPASADEFPADEPLPGGLALPSTRTRYHEHVAEFRDRQDLENYATTTAGETTNNAVRLANARKARDRARLTR